MSIETQEVIVLDTEITPNTFLFRAKSRKTGHRVAIWFRQEDTKEQRAEELRRLRGVLSNDQLIWVTFNGDKFDIPIITYAASGSADCSDLYEMAQTLISRGVPSWVVMRDYGLESLELNHIDICETMPGVMISLKLYGARMGVKNLQDMPFAHDHWMTEDERINVMLPYCDNDIDTTEIGFLAIKQPLLLREELGRVAGIDLRSKSDAQLAEAIIAKKLRLPRASGTPPESVRYAAPSFIAPKHAGTAAMLKACRDAEFVVKASNGAIEAPNFLRGKNGIISIGDGTYQMGIGGLHSTHDKRITHRSDSEFIICDWDVESFYPRIGLNAGFAPAGMGKPFLDHWHERVESRVDAKRQLNSGTVTDPQLLAHLKSVNEGGKIEINGTFGKLGSVYSKIYAPDLMLGITLSGQFYLLTLIDYLTDVGIEVLSANTDGICVKAPRRLEQKMIDIVTTFGMLSGFKFERTDYSVIALKDVNNYLAIKAKDGSVKGKGLYAEAGSDYSVLMKNPTNAACSIAAAAFLKNGTPVRGTLESMAADLRNFPKFLQARTVNGGSQQGGAYLGRVARWYYSLDHSLDIRYVSNGNLVPRSTGGRACMILPDMVPFDIDLPAYVEEATGHLEDMGAI